MSYRVVIAALTASLLGACAPVPHKPADTGSDMQSAKNRARIHAELGAAYYGAGRYAVAIEELEESLAADPSYVPAINQLGIVYLAIGQEPKAIAQFEKALRIDPNDASVNNNYGMVLCQRDQEKEGLRYLRKALADPLYKSLDAAYVNAGICMRRMGDHAQAEAMLSKALALTPDQPEALYQLAEISFARGDLAAARELITRHGKATQPGAEALWLAARVENRLGNRNALATYGAQLNRRFPGAPQTRAFNEGKFE